MVNKPINGYRLGIQTKKNCVICEKQLSRKEWIKKVITPLGTYGYQHLDCDEEWLARNR